jgi:hypothetical protein
VTWLFEQHDINLLEMDETWGDRMQADPGMLAKLWCAGLRHTDESLTPQAAARLFTFGEYIKVTEAVMRVITEELSAEDEPDPTTRRALTPSPSPAPSGEASTNSDGDHGNVTASSRSTVPQQS